MLLLERDDLRDEAAATLRRAAAGEGSLLVVQGALGVGKSTFLEALSELGREEDTLLLRAQAAAAEESFGLGVVRQLVEPVLAAASTEQARSWLRAAAEGAPPEVRAIAESGLEAPWSALTVQGAPRWLAALVDAMAGGRTVLVIIDDLHWCDAESLKVLIHTLACRGGMRIVFAVSVLTGDVRGNRCYVHDVLALADRTCVLRPLGGDSIRRLVEESCGAPAEPEYVEAFRVRTGGNPLLLGALVDEAQFRGLRPTAAQAPMVSLLRPENVRQRLAGFLRSQPDHLRRAAHALTVLGPDSDPELLADLAELDSAQCAEALRVLRLAGLVAEDGWTLSTGSLLRDLLEESMPAEERTAMRSVAAELLHRSGHSAELAANHLMSTLTLPGDKAVDILRTAARSALHRASTRDAARYLRRALLETSLTGPDRAGLLIELAGAERSFATAASLRHVVEAVPLLDSVRERAAAVVRLGPLLMDPSAFRVDAMMREVAEELAASGTKGPEERELALRLQAREHVLSAQDPAHIAEAVRRFEQLGPHPSMDTPGERELLTALMHIVFVANAVPAARLSALCARLLEQEPPSFEHVHSTLPLVVNILAASGQTEGAASWLRESHRLAQHRGGDVEQAIIRAEQALVAFADGQPVYARRRALQADALTGPETSGLPTMLVAVLAIVALNTADPALAESILVQYRRSAGNEHLSALLHVARGTSAVRRGELRPALDHFRTAGLHMERIGWRNPVALPWPSCVALVHHRLGEHEQAKAAARQEVEQARAWGAPTALGRALLALGRVSEEREGSAILEEAVAVLEQGTNGYELCRALYALGSHAETEPARRANALKRAQELALECQADWMLTRIQSLQSEAPPAAVRKKSRLTPSERKVAGLAATGQSNPEISGELGISSRMVEKHLSNTYRKLDIPGRPSLAAALAELDEEA
uniref:SalRII n=1 Tax=Streptomyces albus TaxID=1888 RepID=Q197Z0_9ACTN|nr:SalRII [Streptomyces albus]